MTQIEETSPPIAPEDRPATTPSDIGEEARIAGIGTLPVAGTQGLIATGGFGIAQGTNGTPLSGAALYPVVVPNIDSPASGHLADSVEAALAEDGRLSPTFLQNVRVSILTGNIVHLGGDLPSPAELETARRITASVRGVAGVE